MSPELKREILSLMKSDLKALAKQIRFSRRKKREYESRMGKGETLTKEEMYDYYHLQIPSRDFRSLHIARCLICGKTLEQVEKPKKENVMVKPDYVETFKATTIDVYQRKLEEKSKPQAVCASPAGSESVAASSPSGACASGVPAPESQGFLAKWGARLLGRA